MTDPVSKPGDAAPVIEFKDEPIDLSDIKWDDTFVLLIFWGLALVVFLQFFTRYILNDALGWTEEIARFMLIGLTFVGSIMAARKQSHIAVEFMYRWMPRGLRIVLQIFVDVTTIVFFALLTWLSTIVAGKTRQMMVSIDVPKSAIYWGVSVCFAFMTLYAVLVALSHWRKKTSRLIDPHLFEDNAPLRD